MVGRSKFIIPTASMLNKDIEDVDYGDSFSEVLSYVVIIDFAQIGKAFFIKVTSN